MARWQLWLSVPRFNVVHCAGIETKDVHAFSPPPTAENEKAKLDDKMPELNISRKIFRIVSNVGVVQEEEKFEDYSTVKEELFLFLPEVFLLVNRGKNRARRTALSQAYSICIRPRRMSPTSSNSPTTENVVFMRCRWCTRDSSTSSRGITAAYTRDPMKSRI